MPRIKIGVLISGGGTNLQTIIDNTLNGTINGEVSLVISNKKEAYGLTRAENAKIENLFIDPKDFPSMEDYNRALIQEFKKRDIQLIVLAGYLKVLSKDFIENFQYIINIHPSLIPSFCGKGYYGERVHEKVLEYGVKITGATVHFVDEGTDTGPIILQDIVRVQDYDTVETLQRKVLQVEHRLLPEAVKLFCDNRLKIEGRRVVTRN